MKKIYIILLSIIGVISSCTKHEDIIDTSLQPGSILCSDGSIVHPSLFSPNEKEAIGVVFWCNDGNNPDIKETAYAVSLEDLEENPLIDTDEDIANVSEDENSFDGAANTAAIMNFAIKDSSLSSSSKSYRIRTKRCYRLVYWLYRTKQSNL